MTQPDQSPESRCGIGIGAVGRVGEIPMSYIGIAIPAASRFRTSGQSRDFYVRPPRTVKHFADLSAPP